MADPQSTDLLWKIIDGLVALVAVTVGFVVKIWSGKINSVTTDLKEHKKHVYSKLENQDRLLSEAVTKLSESHMTAKLCDSRHQLWDERLENLLKNNAEQHGHIGDVMLSVAEELKELQACVTKLGKGKECD